MPIFSKAYKILGILDKVTIYGIKAILYSIDFYSIAI